MSKKTLLVTVAIIAGSILVGSVSAFGVAGASITPNDTGSDDEARIITTTGTGIVTAKPDKFTINFTVTTNNKSAREAQQNNDTKINAFIDALKDAGVTEDDMKTVSYRLDTAYEWNPDTRKNEMIGYKASYTLQVVRYDLAEMGDIIDLATSNGVNNIGTIIYGVQNPEKLTNDALVLAMRDAHDKADIALGEYDLEIARVGNIHLNTYDPVAPPMAYDKSDMRAVGAEESGGVAPNIIAGDLEYRVNVNVTFEF